MGVAPAWCSGCRNDDPEDDAKKTVTAPITDNMLKATVIVPLVRLYRDSSAPARAALNACTFKSSTDTSQLTREEMKHLTTMVKQQFRESMERPESDA
jgi:hypothetical protein